MAFSKKVPHPGYRMGQNNKFLPRSGNCGSWLESTERVTFTKIITKECGSVIGMIV